MFRYSLLQVTFAVSADDGELTVKNELFGVIEEPRDPALVTVATLSTFPPTSPLPTTPDTHTTAAGRSDDT